MAVKTHWWPCFVGVVLLAIVLGLATVHWQKQSEFDSFIKEHGLTHYESTFSSAGVSYLEQFASPDLLEHEVFEKLSAAGRNKIHQVSEKLASSLLLFQWLDSRQLQHHHGDVQAWLDKHKQKRHRGSHFGYTSVRQLAMLTQEEISHLITYLKTTEFETYLLREGIKELAVEDSWRQLILNPTFSSVQKMKDFFIFDRLLILTMPLGLLCFWVWGNYQLARGIPQQQGRERPSSILNYITGSLLDVNCCKVEWGWAEPAIVGETMSFVIKFFQRNRRPYIINRDNSLPVIIEITVSQQRVACSLEYGTINEVKASFTVRRAGLYTITVRLGQMNIRGSPYRMNFLPGPVDPSKSAFVRHSSTMVVTRGHMCPLFIEPRDQFGNPCLTSLDTNRGDRNKTDDYCLQVTEIGSDTFDSKKPHYEVKPSQDRQLALRVRMETTGCYKALVTYRKEKLSNGEFNILVLSENDAEKVKKNLDKKSTEGYEATLLTHNNAKQRRPKKVYCYISPKQLTVKEFYLRIIPKRLQTFRVCPATKFNFSKDQAEQEVPVFSVEDGCQPPMQLASKHRDVMAATFTKFLLTNIGGSETFQDKQRCFHREVVSLKPRKHHSVVTLNIDRHSLLESSMKATKPFSTSDWCKKFEISFLGEEGQDWGGLGREWTELVCTALFAPENKFFKRFRDNNQGLVHPNPERPPHLCKTKYYEFAGKVVGKCLYESSLGSVTRQLVKARFSRSFLAQLIGLRVSHKYFETDDPDFYTTKVRFILDNDVNDMGLTFSEEVYSKGGQLAQEVDLIPGGASTPVTNDNKTEYLDKLAQHRLANNVQEEIEAFLKGLNDLIPDQLLSMFDENELELLMCGTCAFSVTDMQRHYIPSGQGEQFGQMLDWFWTVVASFTQEEMARLLQFTTGCSQLPPGGFAELSPKFQVIAAPTHGTLPTAHTCFNQLCLPTYDSIEHLQKALVLAINEGGEGFGLL
ncbi:apoptosis-resistant E3 ubiquitin protein ligase 1-like [Acanthaster planci]|uniref:HECT-type E3 ubiquitin transferase n=1 Tax=Acanthaster planci TaxID=133434 RepID=A0A8B7YCC2_ACAPL|nr:apoptosis-resistant E3 ubiquitin protein ligase 1-like [Acanthaster planci]XP_022090892.1 apoptosis-resistant E3 ubiquitin protein ligase 1-like [Acanthaster planci]XP_022090893.1 apoptosis-resistant E3 ubiquitin protein ligase 1-like [Acanthaster planci]XP_022090894.1 apoptosis-resistant E3 ubiquitin protein ligase 1-like [Acanthaster planci]